jgi:hypothetical protein
MHVLWEVRRKKLKLPGLYNLVSYIPIETMPHINKSMNSISASNRKK